ncbi:MAG: MFS transporter [Candidatus Goldbacteria bacterium]|nr:MFS transporter [Candidatus Goldiibacteriota bacterium]
MKNKNLQIFLLTIILFTAGMVLSGAFVNIYIWKLKYDYNLIIKYLISSYITVPFVFYLCGYIGMYIDRLSIYKIGIVFHSIFYLFVLLVREKITENLVLFGIIYGIAMGFYWFGYHILTIDYTEIGKREKFYSTTSIIASVSSMMGPLISGFIIHILPDLKGYYVIFAISSFLMLSSVILVSPLKSKPILKPYKIEDLIFTKNKKWFKTMVGYFFISGNDAISMFLISILVVKTTGSEFTFGKLAFLVSLISITTSYLVGKFSKPHTRSNYVITGAIIYFFIAFILVYKINFNTLIIYSILSSVSGILIRIPFSAYAMDLISLDANINERKMEYIVARDVPIAIGRITSLVIFMIFLKYFDVTAIKMILLLISTFPFAIYWAMYRYK